MCVKCGGKMRREEVCDGLVDMRCVTYCLCEQCGNVCFPKDAVICYPETCDLRPGLDAKLGGYA
jgi:hypothetical protein